ncbi:MAG TPA: rhamnogalacturonan lyase [Blastocatellia bacterium]|nr:rhamnogalacturonan lyase [Blastocatellia bacterium]
MKQRTTLTIALALATLFLAGSLKQLDFRASTQTAPSVMEYLDRGMVALRRSENEVYVGWRLLGTDPPGISFNLYRADGDCAETQLNAVPITNSTNYVDSGADLSRPNAYFVRPIVNGVELEGSELYTLPANAAIQQFITVPLQTLAGHTPNDAAVGDLDGDGQYEIVLKQEMTPRDNSQSGTTGETKLEAYKLNGTLMWRINLGRNIREGAHYTQFIVYDLDSDGRAEVACKTSDATVDGTGRVIGNASANYRNSSGYVLTGPEYLTIFDGRTGAALATTNYLPPRGTVSSWGDSYGNRVDRFLACVAYLDGTRPSLVMTRGYYTRAVLVAWDWRGGRLTRRWTFDSRDGTAGNTAYDGQGNHNLSVGDVDGDGRDEITFGASAIDDNGRGLYSTGLGHGDALHMSDMDPDRAGMEVYQPHESPSAYGSCGSEMRDARTGARLWCVSGEGADVGRGVAMDIDPRFRGYEAWSSRGGLMSAKGVRISTTRPSQINFGIWWDGDLLRELLDNITISKWNYTSGSASTLLTATGAASNNGTKATPALSADIMGDWREEVILRSADNRSLRIYSTTIATSNRIYTLMQNRQYRLAVAWQNIGYNQPPHPSFYLGDGMSTPPPPNIVTAQAGKILPEPPAQQ